MTLDEAEGFIREIANADGEAVPKVYRAAAGIVLGALTAERARSAALEAEVERLRELGVELVERFHVAVNRYDLAKVLRRLLDQDGYNVGRETSRYPIAELESLSAWLESWGDGPNWFDASGETVPLALVTIERLTAAYGEWHVKYLRGPLRVPNEVGLFNELLMLCDVVRQLGERWNREGNLDGRAWVVPCGDSGLSNLLELARHLAKSWSLEVSPAVTREPGEEDMKCSKCGTEYAADLAFFARQVNGQSAVITVRCNECGHIAMDRCEHMVTVQKRELLRNNHNFATFQDEYAIAIEALTSIAEHAEGSHPVIAGVALAKIRHPSKLEEDAEALAASPTEKKT